MVPQVKNSTHQDFFVQRRTIRDSVYSHLTKVADTTKKRYYLDHTCTTIYGEGLYAGDLDTFLHNLLKFKVLDIHLSVFQPDDFRDLLLTMTRASDLSSY